MVDFVAHITPSSEMSEMSLNCTNVCLSYLSKCCSGLGVGCLSKLTSLLRLTALALLYIIFMLIIYIFLLYFILFFVLQWKRRTAL